MRKKNAFSKPWVSKVGTGFVDLSRFWTCFGKRKVGASIFSSFETNSKTNAVV